MLTKMAAVAEPISMHENLLCDYFVKVAVPQFMEQKKPYNLRVLMVFVNFFVFLGVSVVLPAFEPAVGQWLKLGSPKYTKSQTVSTSVNTLEGYLLCPL